MLARGTPWFVAIPPALLALSAVAMAAGSLDVAWWSLLAVALLLMFSFLGIYFFRDPERTPGEGLVAPAHGRVLGVDEEGDRVRVSTFMGPMDVHVIRAPMKGKVLSLERSGSGFHRADTTEAGHNVQLTIELKGDREVYTVVMVSGWFARRIVPHIAPGDTVERGARIGLIRFGSRVDVLVPKNEYRITVGPGTRVRAGSSSLGVRLDADN
jgi:phosphatidylserine decarboxylase